MEPATLPVPLPPELKQTIEVYASSRGISIETAMADLLSRGVTAALSEGLSNAASPALNADARVAPAKRDVDTTRTRYLAAFADQM